MKDVIDLSKCVLIGLAILYGFGCFSNNDSTNYPGEHSVLSIKIDAKTGCHYLSSGFSLTPRYDKQGDQICTGKEE